MIEMAVIGYAHLKPDLSGSCITNCEHGIPKINRCDNLWEKQQREPNTSRIETVSS